MVTESKYGGPWDDTFAIARTREDTVLVKRQVVSPDLFSSFPWLTVMKPDPNSVGAEPFVARNKWWWWGRVQNPLVGAEPCCTKRGGGGCSNPSLLETEGAELPGCLKRVVGG